MPKKNVTEQVLEYIKEQLRVGRWAYGEKIDSENQLTYELHVSRASVRHAIQQLVAIGVLESFQGKGTFVKTLPESVMMNRLENIYLNQDRHTLAQFRNTVESAACREAVLHITSEMLQQMEMLVCIMEGETVDAGEFMRADEQFHGCILKASGNRIFEESMKIVSAELRRQYAPFQTPETRKRAAEYHRRILEAIKAGSPGHASDLMAQHLMIAENEIKKNCGKQ